MSGLGKGRDGVEVRLGRGPQPHVVPLASTQVWAESGTSHPFLMDALVLAWKPDGFEEILISWFAEDPDSALTFSF